MLAGESHEDRIPHCYGLVDELAGRLLKGFRGARRFWSSRTTGIRPSGGCWPLISCWLSGGFCGLRGKREPSRGVDVDDVVDWGRSLAVAWSGYYARIFVNAGGEEAVDVKRELRRRLSVLKAPWGHIRNAVFEPAELYREVRGDAPDLMVYFDSLRVRPVQTVGYESPWLEGNDRGPDDSLHSFNGFYAATWGDVRRKDLHALDVAGFLERVL